MRRNLRFWTRYTWEVAGVNLCLTAALLVVTALGADSVQLQLLASVVPYFLLISAAMCAMFCNMGSQTLYVPLLISMGETRRNILLGFHYYRCLIIVVTVGLCAILWALVPGEVSSIGLRSFPAIFAVLVLTSALGSLMGTIYIKWKWVSMILIVVLCGGFGGAMGLLFSGGVALQLASTIDLTSALLRLPWWLAAAALAAFLLDLVFQWLLLRRREVKL